MVSAPVKQISSEDSSGALAIERPFEIRHEIVLLKPILQVLELSVGPSMFGQTFPDRLDRNLDAGVSDEVRDQKRFVFYRISHVKDHFGIFQGFVALAEGQFSTGFYLKARAGGFHF